MNKTMIASDTPVPCGVLSCTRDATIAIYTADAGVLGICNECLIALNKIRRDQATETTPEPHQHRYKIVTSNQRTLRYCVHRASWVMLVASDIVHPGRFVGAEWHEIEEGK